MANGRDEHGRFAKGHKLSVGNNGGRPKRTDEERFMGTLFTVVDDDKLKKLLEKLYELALRGIEWAMKLLFAYYAGLPVERKEVTGAEGGPLVVRYVNDWRDQATNAASGAKSSSEPSG